VKQKKLFEQFPPVTTQEWIDKITADLKGSDFNKKMVWKTGEGFDVMPFYRKES
jgi:methylmalonyl-CoA mutase